MPFGYPRQDALAGVSSSLLQGRTPDQPCRCPKARHLDLSYGSGSLHSCPDIETDRIPWSQLTTLTVGECDATDIMYILKEGRNLVLLDVAINNFPSIPPAPVTTEALRTLSVGAKADCAEFFSNVISPSLTTFKHSDFDIVTPSHQLIDFLRRSQCSLTTLEITMYDENDIEHWESSDWIALLDAVPSLTTLLVPSRTLKMFRSATALMEMSYPRAGGKSLLPKLETMVISLECIDYSFVQMIQNRQAGVSEELGPDCNIRSLYLDDVWEADEGAVDMLHSMKEEGLHVSVSGSLKLDAKYRFDRDNR